MEFPPIKICTKTKLTEEQLKYAIQFLPNLRSRKNKYQNSDEYHVCYCIINLLDSRCYFGKHTFDYDPKTVKYSFYVGSSTWLKNAILKYGAHNFRMIILKYFKSSKAAYAYEKSLISLDMISSIFCYNRQGGGKTFARGSKHHIHEKVKNGTCPLQKRPDGSGGGGLNNKGTRPWENSGTTPDSILTWLLADCIYKIHKAHLKYDNRRICKILHAVTGINLSPNANVLKRIKTKKWKPERDKKWQLFREENIVKKETSKKNTKLFLQP
jgi:hypothetical protein